MNREQVMQDAAPEIDFRLPNAKLFPNIRKKILSLVKLANKDNVDVEYEFPPLLNNQRALIHNLCDAYGFFHESGPALSIDFEHHNYRRGVTLKHTTISITPKENNNVSVPPAQDKKKHKFSRKEKRKRRQEQFMSEMTEEELEEVEDIVAMVDLESFVERPTEERATRWRSDGKSRDEAEESIMFITEDLDDGPTPIEVVIDAMKEIEKKKRADRSVQKILAAQANTEYQLAKQRAKKKRSRQENNKKERRSSYSISEEAPSFVSGGVIATTEQLEIIVTTSSSSSPDQEENNEPLHAPMHSDFAVFIEESSVGNSVMNMMSKMGYIEGKGLGKEKQGMVNPIMVSHMHGKVFQIQSDFDPPKQKGFKYVNINEIDYDDDEAAGSSTNDRKYEKHVNRKSRVNQSPDEPTKREKKKLKKQAKLGVESQMEVPVQEKEPQIEEEVFLLAEDFFQDHLHLTLCEHLEIKLQHGCNQTEQMQKNVAFEFIAPPKTEDNIRIKNMCRKWKVRYEKRVIEDKKKKHQKSESMIRVTIVFGKSRNPQEEEEQELDDENDTSSTISDPYDHVYHVKKNKNEFINVAGMSDSEFLRFVEHKLADLVDESNHEKPVLVYNFPPLDARRRDLLVAICHRCNISVDLLLERKLGTRSAKNHKLLEMGMHNPEAKLAVKPGGLQGTVVQVTITCGVSIRPHKLLIRAVVAANEKDLAKGDSKQVKKERKRAFSKKQKNIAEAVSKVINQVNEATVNC